MTVWAVHQPTGRDRETGQVINTMDLSPAEEFGELRFVLRDWENPFADPQATWTEIEESFDEDSQPESGLQEGDYLLLVGNPILIGLVCAAAADRVQTLNLLQWNRSEGKYLPVSIQLFSDDLPDYVG